MALLSITVAFNASSANFLWFYFLFFFTITLDSGLLICVQPETHLRGAQTARLRFALATNASSGRSLQICAKQSSPSNKPLSEKLRTIASYQWEQPGSEMKKQVK